MIDVSIFVAPTPATFGANLRRRMEELSATIDRDMKLLGQRLVARAKSGYLSGPRPGKIGVVTGRLRSSINAALSSSLTNRGRTVELRFGTDVPYARKHEYGFRGTETVRVHLRRLTGRASQVRQHMRRVNLKPRPFLTPAVADNVPWFRPKLVETLKRIARGTGG
jgi:phage gpG-like protein